VIVNPCFPVSAAWAYQHLNPGAIESADENILNPLLAAWSVGDFSAMTRYLRNDLAPAVFDKFPVLSIIKRELLGAGALGVEMTGSGPTLFAICHDRAFADAIAKVMQEKYPEFLIWSTIQGGIK
jgi:4-diphosphocytidyl-2C-methyl-D-erythritol kinase